ncbi:MAG TPA: hypothetical protein VIW24_19135 [Aldersonia sp.]
MHVQLTYFDGPRTPEQVAAGDRAGRERIGPAVLGVPGMVGAYLCRRADGSEVVISIAESEQALLDAQQAVMTSELLPGEDPAMLTGPDRIEIYPLLEGFGAFAAAVAS